MDESLKKHLRIVWIILGLLVLLFAASLALAYFSPHKDTVKNYVGQPGKNGLSVQGPMGSQGIQGEQGIQGMVGVQGPQGAQGPQGLTGADSTVPGSQGPTGETGQDGKTPVFRCHNGNWQTQYVGDEDWVTLQKNSQACQGL